MKEQNGGMKFFIACIFALSILFRTAPLWGAPEPGRTYKVGVVTITDNQSMNDGFNAARRRLADLGYVKGENVRLYRRIVLGDPSGFWNQLSLLDSLNGFIEEFIEEKVDIAIIVTGPALYYGRKPLIDAGIPVIFGGLVNPEALGCQSAVHCGDLVTGATIKIEPEKVLRFLRNAVPKGKRFCAVTTNDLDARHSLKLFRETFEKDKSIVFSGESVLSFSGKGLYDEVVSVMDGCDAFIALPDPMYLVNKYRTAIDTVALANSKGIPAVSTLDIVCQLGAPFAIGVSVEDHGRMLADLAVRVLEGEKPGEIPIQNPKTIHFWVNGEAVSYLGLRLPSSILLNAKRVETFPFVDKAKVFPKK